MDVSPASEHALTRSWIEYLAVVFAVYAGVMWPFAWVCMAALAVFLDPVSGDVDLLWESADAGTYKAVVVYMSVWGAVHLGLPGVALVAAMGLRYRAAWACGLASSLAMILVPLPPLGPFVGGVILYVLRDEWVRDQFQN